MKCQQCAREIITDICPHCGGRAEALEIQVGDDMTVIDVVPGVVVKGASEVSIEKDGKVQTFKFDPDVRSGDIVNASLARADLSDVTPQYVQNQIVTNINTIEKYSDDDPTLETEHSFEFNLKVFKYRYRTKKMKPDE
jgi:hypothetical protein